MQKLFTVGLLAVWIQAQEREFAIAMTKCINFDDQALRPTTWNGYWMTSQTQARIKAGCQSLHPSKRGICIGNIDNVKLTSQNYASSKTKMKPQFCTLSPSCTQLCALRSKLFKEPTSRNFCLEVRTSSDPVKLYEECKARVVAKKVTGNDGWKGVEKVD